MMYLCKFDDEGNRTETYVKNVHFYSENDDFVKQKLNEGFEWVTDKDYNNLLGNNVENQIYIKDTDGVFKPKPPYVPTAEELKTQALTSLEIEYNSTKEEFKNDLDTATLAGNTEAVQSIQKEFMEFNKAYEDAKNNILRGE